MLVNLVGNAMKFTRVRRGRRSTSSLADDGDRDRHRPRLRRPRHRHRHRRAKQARVFDAFAQADAGVARSFGGTGLGLAISGRLVALMGGTIALTSREGHGSIFTFTIAAARRRRADGVEARPAGAGRRHAGPARAGRRRQRHQPPHPRRDAAPVGLRADARRRTARRRSPRSTRRAAGREPFDLLLVDVHMPGIDGFTLLERARGAPRPRRRRRGDADVRSPARRSRSLPRAAGRGAPDQAGPPGAAAPGRRRGHRPARRRGRRAGRRGRPSPPPPARDRLRVLVAEDNAVNQQLARRDADAPAATTSCSPRDGAEAVAEWATGGFDVVFMDVQMPEMDGFDATRAIRRARGRHRRPRADRRDDRARHAGRSRALPRRRHGRLRHQADLARRARPRPRVDPGPPGRSAPSHPRHSPGLARASAPAFSRPRPAHAWPIPAGPRYAGLRPAEARARPDVLGAADSMAP